jgi:hypothetical protein
MYRSAPAFATNKSPSVRKRKTPEDGLKRGTKRFRAGRARPTYSMEQDVWDDEGYEEAGDADWDEDETADDQGSSTWDTLAFQQKATFPPCTTPYCKEKNIAHTHSTTNNIVMYIRGMVGICLAIPPYRIFAG